MRNKNKIEKHCLANDAVYHIVSRSIAHYVIFNTDKDYLRMVRLLHFYQVRNPVTKFSMFFRLKGAQAFGFDQYLNMVNQDQEKMIEIIAYCLMPNHIHLVLKQLKNKGVSTFISNILNSYTRYFNILHKRKGPLWESRFKHILVEKDEQLQHLSRYIHLNPTSAKLVKNPEQWKYSSYLEYLKPNQDVRLTHYEDLLEINPKSYKNFVNDRKDYQRRLSEIKKIVDL